MATTNDPAVLAVDLGTGGPKIALVSLRSQAIKAVHHRVEPRVSASGAALASVIVGLLNSNLWMLPSNAAAVGRAGEMQA